MKNATVILVDGSRLDVLEIEENSPTTYKITLPGGENSMFYTYDYIILKRSVLAIEVE
ncbi:MAG: hypothetical protein J6Z11_17445 [Candidatus Riflebacteria bacterium]|nr:hypothetical protein [Candidatus Riflebacteria bacterium]